MKKFVTRFLSALLVGFAGFLGLQSTEARAADDNFIVVASTTSTQNSGLFEHILPKFTEETGIEVRVVAVGTGCGFVVAGAAATGRCRQGQGAQDDDESAHGVVVVLVVHEHCGREVRSGGVSPSPRRR